MRIKAICITAPLSFPVPFIYPPTTKPSPRHPFQQTHHTIPHFSNGKLASRVVGRKGYITSTHYLVILILIPRSFLSPCRLKPPLSSILHPCSSPITPQLPLGLLLPAFLPVHHVLSALPPPYLQPHTLTFCFVSILHQLIPTASAIHSNAQYDKYV